MIEEPARALEEGKKAMAELIMEIDMLKRRLIIYENPHAPPSHGSVPTQQKKARSAKGPLLKIYSHEEQGRYPEIIDNKSSLEWYNEKHLGLRKLEEEIENACYELDKKFFLDSDD